MSAVEVKVRLKITLATEWFQGRDHTGAPSQSYMLNHPVTIFSQSDNDKLRWVQNRDREGHYNDRLPGNGLVTTNNQGDCKLTDQAGGTVAVLSGFTAPVSSSSGTAEFKYHIGNYQGQKESRTDWVGRGVWELVQDSSDAPAPRYISSAWKFNTSKSISLGVLMAEGSSGTLVLTDPAHVDRRFAYVGGGASADVGKVLKFLKTLKNVAWIQKMVKSAQTAGEVVSTASSVSVSASSEDMFSTGLIIKNVLVAGTRELTKDDFLGPCLWVDGSLALGGGVSGMFLLTNVQAFGPIVVSPACIPCGGVTVGSLSAGVGACMGWISPG